MQLMGSEPLYNNNKIIPQKISSVPSAAQHKAEVKCQRKLPTTKKSTTKAATIAHFRKGICETCVDYSPVLPKEAIDYSGSQIFCQFEGKKEEEIPFYLRNR